MAKTEPSKEIRPYDQFLNYVQERVSQSDDYQVADELATEQVERLAVAESLDDLFDAMRMQGLVGLKYLDNGTELQVNGYRLVRSTRDDLAGRTGVYAIIDAQDLFDGHEVALDTGIERILVFLIKCEQLNLFPVQVKITKKQTSNGNEVITFAPLAKRAATSAA